LKFVIRSFESAALTHNTLWAVAEGYDDDSNENRIKTKAYSKYFDNCYQLDTADGVGGVNSMPVFFNGNEELVLQCIKKTWDYQDDEILFFGPERSADQSLDLSLEEFPKKLE
jgi:hypothetical protein